MVELDCKPNQNIQPPAFDEFKEGFDLRAGVTFLSESAGLSFLSRLRKSARFERGGFVKPASPLNDPSSRLIRFRRFKRWLWSFCYHTWQRLERERPAGGF